MSYNGLGQLGAAGENNIDALVWFFFNLRHFQSSVNHNELTVICNINRFRVYLNLIIHNIYKFIHVNIDMKYLFFIISINLKNRHITVLPYRYTFYRGSIFGFISEALHLAQIAYR